MTDAYEVLDICGDGTFSIVYKVKQKSGALFAIKKAKEVRYERPANERIANEIKILHAVQHENVITILSLEESSSRSFAKMNSLNIQLNVNSIMFPYCPLTLKNLIQDYILIPFEKKSCIFMILEGVSHIHNCGLIHRDLSPSNILISDSGVIKVADFGAAWMDSNCDREPRGKMKFEVGTRYYRAPELLFSAGNYSNAIDLWSLGCIFSEFFTEPVGSPLFCGESDIDQLSRIFRVLGTPNLTTWPEMKEFPDYGKFTFITKEFDGFTNRQLPNSKSQDIVQFISRFLKYSSAERVTASQASLDPLFDGFSKTYIDVQKLKARKTNRSYSDIYE